MKSLLLALLVLMVTAVGLAFGQRVVLPTPESVGVVTGYDISRITLNFNYDPATNSYVFIQATVVAVEGEVLDEGLSTESFKVHESVTHTIEAANFTQAFRVMAANLRDKASGQHGSRR